METLPVNTNKDGCKKSNKRKILFSTAEIIQESPEKKTNNDEAKKLKNKQKKAKVDPAISADKMTAEVEETNERNPENHTKIKKKKIKVKAIEDEQNLTCATTVCENPDDIKKQTSLKTKSKKSNHQDASKEGETQITDQTPMAVKSMQKQKSVCGKMSPEYDLNNAKVIEGVTNEIHGNISKKKAKKRKQSNSDVANIPELSQADDTSETKLKKKSKKKKSKKEESDVTSSDLINQGSSISETGELAKHKQPKKKRRQEPKGNTDATAVTGKKLQMTNDSCDKQSSVDKTIKKAKKLKKNGPKISQNESNLETHKLFSRKGDGMENVQMNKHEPLTKSNKTEELNSTDLEENKKSESHSACNQLDLGKAEKGAKKKKRKRKSHDEPKVVKNTKNGNLQESPEEVSKVYKDAKKKSKKQVGCYNKSPSKCDDKHSLSEAKAQDDDNERQKKSKKMKRKQISNDAENSKRKKSDDNVLTGLTEKKKKKKAKKNAPDPSEADTLTTLPTDNFDKSDGNMKGKAQDKLKNSNKKTNENQQKHSSEATSLGQWSTAQLADQSKQEKFLRLLGGRKAQKNPNANKLWSGAVPKTVSKMALNQSDSRKLATGLEEQYTKALEFKLQKRNEQNMTKGLGFQEDPSKGKKFYIDVSKSNSIKFND
ncbi:unnamed protein product [Clavelina lepadiformis]|uniref:Small acidic protein-like domain-containing protein n=1 Tax=Clavelina lepadiformis TaxID=159417 RepID=A0ABP0H3S7_CLALP